MNSSYTEKIKARDLRANDTIFFNGVPAKIGGILGSTENTITVSIEMYCISRLTAIKSKLVTIKKRIQ